MQFKDHLELNRYVRQMRREYLAAWDRENQRRKDNIKKCFDIAKVTKKSCSFEDRCLRYHVSPTGEVTKEVLF